MGDREHLDGMTMPPLGPMSPVPFGAGQGSEPPTPFEQQLLARSLNDPTQTQPSGSPPVAGSDPSHFDTSIPTDPQNPQAPPTLHAQPTDPSIVSMEAQQAPLGQSINDDGLQGPVNPALVPEPAQPTPMDPVTAAQLKASAAALYGADFPLLKATAPIDTDWVSWASSLWDRHRAGMQKILHAVERNRLFRADQQWIVSGGLAPWREPAKPRDMTRAVENVIKPALDLRVQIVREQIPGFQTNPTNQDNDAQKRAEAQQKTLEYCYREQDMAYVIAEAAYWAGTDGVAFVGPYWHPDAGPWTEKDGRQIPLGDARTCVYRIEQVRVSANATATHRPSYWIVRETIPTAEAVAQHGPAVVDQLASSQGSTSSDIASLSMDRLGLGTPGVQELYRDQETVDRFTVYCERSEFLPNGLTLVAVGNAMVTLGPLLYGVVPLARFTDGSSDPAFFPTPEMNGWVPHQMRINAAKSKWIDSVRVNATGRFITRKGTMVTETLVGGTTSILEVNGPFTNPSEALVPVQGFSIGDDLKELLDRERQLFEQKSGWNDTTRGSFSGDDDKSGRAILAIREQVERIFMPAVQAASKAMKEWGEITLNIYRVMLKMPRAIAIVGASRTDLARQITAEDFSGVASVEIDPETLMPMPRSLRLYLLQQLYSQQVISPQEYRRRLPFAFTGSIETPDDRKEARAQRIADAILQGQPVPQIRWTDNESIVQDVLESEILDRDDLDPQVIQTATEVWQQYAQQSAVKSGAVPAPSAGGGGAANGAGPNPPNTSILPNQQPTFGSSPSIAAAPAAMQHQTDQAQAGAQFDQMNRAAA